MSDSKYDQRGVSSDKSEVHEAIRHLDKGLYPNAFCKILPDITGNDPEQCCIMHADTAGTKTALAYMYWKETGDASVFAGIAQDAIVMNLDDMACAGAVDNFILSSTIGRNKHLITAEVLEQVIGGTTAFIERMATHGINIHLAGGETADVGDIVRTIDVGYTAFVRMPRAQVQTIGIGPGDVVVGLASYGQATYEDRYNSGIASNGLTAARHDTLHRSYADRFPESFDPAIPRTLVFTGKHKLTDQVPGTPHTVGELLLSPTRTYVPVLKALFERLTGRIRGIIHNTGGAHSKVLKFAQNLRIVKDSLLHVPPVFRLIQESSGTPAEEMYKVFNMGTRLEVYLQEQDAQTVIDTARSFGIDAQVIGRVEASETAEVMMVTEDGNWVYRS